jgi:hypothetical protein
VVLAVIVRPMRISIGAFQCTTSIQFTLDAAICNVRLAIGSAVLFDMRELIKRLASVSRETLKRTLMVVLVTVISLLVSGTDEAKVHSSSSVALVLLCAKLDVGGAMAPPNRSIVAGAAGGGLTDC